MNLPQLGLQFFSLSIFLGCLPSYVLANEDYGQFNGTVLTEWLREPNEADRDMLLKEEFEYIDPDGRSWTVPEGTKIDGASIPDLLWSVVGPPFVGDYREASVVHDYYCDEKTRPYEEVHRMFEQAVLAGGVDEIKAKAMYAAVNHFGPKWEVIKSTISSSCSGNCTNNTNVTTTRKITYDIESVYKPEKLEEVIEWIEANNPSLDEIDRRIAKINEEKNRTPIKIIESNSGALQ